MSDNLQGESSGKYFIWDLQKEMSNVRKHGVDFATASKAFLDPQRKYLRTACTVKTKKDYFASVKSARPF